uniref:Uncharacterized protein n=1 Tax=Arundo donax TaxID=35708 RepID=A0A0A9F421_ARUDO
MGGVDDAPGRLRVGWGSGTVVELVERRRWGRER